MSRKKQSVFFSAQLLEEYQSAAIRNAHSLYQEANTLLSYQYNARAYFLAVASFEETGKAALAFNARGRKLQDSALQSRLNAEFLDHLTKISAAFIALLRGLKEADRKSIQYIIGLQVSLVSGREPSMYVGINEAGSVYIPNNVIPRKSASDCVRLAKDCLAQTETMLKNDKPFAFTFYQDQLFSLGKKAKKVCEESNFHEYLLYVIENEELNSDTIPKSVCMYYNDYLSKGKKFIQ